MPVTWKTTDSFERLLAAWWASSETHKPNYRLIAKYYGKGTTYDSIEGRFRHIKRQAEALKAEASADGSIDLDSPGQSFASTSASVNGSSRTGNGTPKKARAPRTPKKDGTSGGRVSKNSTPTKTPRGRKAANGHAQQRQRAVKLEMGSAGESSQSGSASMLDELNEVVDGEVDWMNGVSAGEGHGEGAFGGRARNGLTNGIGGGCGAEVGVGGGYYWNVGDEDEEEDLGDTV